MSAIACKTILYLEDNPVNAYLVQSIFEGRPAVQLIMAATGAEGLDLAARHRPALVLLDMNLPDMHGSEFLRRLRADESQPAQVIVVSADTVAEQRSQFENLGVAEFIAKPFELDEFEKIIARCLNE